jgi:hypothetical protein
VGQEELLEGGIVGGHGDGKLRLMEVAGKALGKWGSLADGFLDDVGKFGGVCRGENKTLGRLGVRFSKSFPGVNADRTVGIRHVAITVPDRVHFLECLLVGGPMSPDFLADIFETIAAEIEQTWKIVGIADVHGVGISGNGRAGFIFAGHEVLRDNIISVGGSDKARNGNAYAFSEDACGEIPEIATGNGNDKRDRSDGQLAVGRDMIEHLRKQTGNVDGVGGGEEGAVVELLVGEGLLNQTLAIVEGTGNFERGDVLAECGELLLLSFADALRGIQNNDTNVRHPEKSVSHCAAGVAGSGDENGKRARLAANEIAHKTSHEAGTEVFEGKRGSVKKFENVKRRREGDEFDGEIDRFGDNLPQNFFRYIWGGKGPYQTKANFGERKAAKFFEFFGSVSGNFGRHVEPAIGRETAEDRTTKRGEGSFAGSGAVAHWEQSAIGNLRPVVISVVRAGGKCRSGR